MPLTPGHLRNRLADIARSNGAYDLAEPVHSTVRIGLWRRSGRPLPAPSAVKRETLRSYARAHGLRTLVETGTYKADTVRALRADFDRIYSVEVDEGLYRRAAHRCRGQRNAVLVHGDSSTALPDILQELDGAALFWLDAHYSGGGTGKTALETPILSELTAILTGPTHGHVVLIDDHREFVRGQVDYPTEREVRELADSAGYVLSQTDDILRLVPFPESRST